MPWNKPERIRVCRDSIGRPVDIIDFGDGKPVIDIGDVATIPLESLEQGLAKAILNGRSS